MKRTHAHRAREMLADVVRDWGPPPLPVYFRCKDDLGDDFAHAYKCDNEKFVIHLLSSMPKALVDYIVIHELAHVYAWDAGAEFRDDHDATWGVAHARVYCSVMGTH